jgi:TonB family protein
MVSGGQPVDGNVRPNVGFIRCLARKRQPITLSASIGIHLALLAWMVHSPAAVFVSPTWVREGKNGTSLSYVYFPGNPNVARAHLPGKLYLSPKDVARKTTPQPKRDSNLQSESNRSEATLLPNQRPAGAPYGSLSYGTISGPDVRAAFPLVFPDPVFGPSELSGEAGDVIVEVTIDDQGNVTQEILVQGFTPPVDQKVMAAIARWHFQPATRNSVPMASKQDVYYHFPR